MSVYLAIHTHRSSVALPHSWRTFVPMFAVVGDPLRDSVVVSCSDGDRVWNSCRCGCGTLPVSSCVRGTTGMLFGEGCFWCCLPTSSCGRHPPCERNPSNALGGMVRWYRPRCDEFLLRAYILNLLEVPPSPLVGLAVVSQRHHPRSDVNNHSCGP